ncbi:MAG: hypothetical protein R3C28_04405 [Pirellulaceae bacterium]
MANRYRWPYHGRDAEISANGGFPDQASNAGKTRTDKTARRYCRTLRMIAAHADPSKFPEQRSRLFPLVNNSLTTWTKQNGVREDEATVSRLKMMLGRDLAVDELTAELIERFDAWLDARLGTRDQAET